MGVSRVSASTNLGVGQLIVLDFHDRQEGPGEGLCRGSAEPLPLYPPMLVPVWLLCMICFASPTPTRSHKARLQGLGPQVS